MQLTQPPDAVLLPRWSPDGRRIAYASRTSGGAWRAFVVDAEGGTPRRITTGDLDETDPSWSPDGKKVTLSGADSVTRRYRIHILDLTSGRHEAIEGSEELFSARWSPDGSHIAAIARTNNRLLVYDVATKGWRELLRGANVGWPSWDARGRYLQVLRDGLVVRVHLDDNRIETVADLHKTRLAISTLIGSSWLGMAHDGAPLILRQVGSASEYYALTVDWHDGRAARQ